MLPGESIDINDIGNNTGPRNGRLTDLVCDTTNINIHCCRRKDNYYEQPLGNWLYPNNSAVVRNNEDRITNDIFVRIGNLRQVRLVKRGNVTGPLGKYTCEVPDMNGIIHRASIYITSSKGDSIILIIYSKLIVNTCSCVDNIKSTLAATVAFVQENLFAIKLIKK